MKELKPRFVSKKHKKCLLFTQNDRFSFEISPILTGLKEKSVSNPPGGANVPLIRQAHKLQPKNPLAIGFN